MKYCAKCNTEIEEDDHMDKIHEMIHLLIDQLNKMPPKYGIIAMTDLLISQIPGNKDDFIKVISDHWDDSRGIQC